MCSFTTVEAGPSARPQLVRSKSDRSVERAGALGRLLLRWLDVVCARTRTRVRVRTEQEESQARDADARDDREDASVHVHGVEVTADVGSELVARRTERRPTTKDGASCGA